jgi:hypothetical protein
MDFKHASQFVLDGALFLVFVISVVRFLIGDLKQLIEELHEKRKSDNKSGG